MMKKNIFLTVLVCVTAAAMIIGILWHVTGIIYPGRKNSSTDKEEEREIQESVQEESGSPEKKTGEIINAAVGTESNDELKSLEMEIQLGDIILRQGRELKVDYTGEEKYEPEIRQKEGVLTIIQPDIHTIFNIGNLHAKVTVTLPEGISLERVDIQEDLGDIEVTDLTASEMTVENALGDIDIADCFVEKMNIQSDKGDVKIKDCLLGKLDVEQDLGDVEISCSQNLSGATLELETDLGTVTVDGEDKGSRHVCHGDSEMQIVVENDLGDIRLETGSGRA